jgi:hypothetical protein
MLKKFTCAAILLASLNTARADWQVHVSEDPMTDEKTVIMLSDSLQAFQSGFLLRYTCWNDKDGSRLFEVWPTPQLQFLFEGEQPERIRVRLDRGRIHTLDFVPEKAPTTPFQGRKLFVHRYNLDNPSERQQFAEFEKDLFESLSRIVIEVKGETRAVETGNAQVAAKKVTEICGAVYPSS